jgi:hypothetical protein
LQQREEALRLVEEGVPYADIAHQTGVNLNTLKSWVRRENHRQARQQVTQALIEDTPDTDEPATPAQMAKKLSKIQRLIDTSIGALEATLRQGVSKSPQSVAVSLEKCIAGSILLSKQLAELEDRDLRLKTEYGQTIAEIIRAVLRAAGVPIEHVADALREVLGHVSEHGDGVIVVSPETTETTRARVLEHFRAQFDVPALPAPQEPPQEPPESPPEPVRDDPEPSMYSPDVSDEEEVTEVEVVVDYAQLRQDAYARVEEERQRQNQAKPSPEFVTGRRSRWEDFSAPGDMSPLVGR